MLFKRLNSVVYKRHIPVALSLSLIVGCTNVASDAARTIHPAPSSSLAAETLFSVAGEFFSVKGYQCDTRRDPKALYCTKELRDLYIHQTRSVVQVYRGDGDAHPHTLVADRWDEGLIPSEFISNEFTNPDVADFCEYLRAQALGSCRLVEY